ncbi:MAG TPA: hypothetical protein VFZ18_03205 [Longimicrobiaceae bacterium]
MIRTSLAMATSLLLAAGTAAAQGPAAQGQLGTPNYDVVLEVPELSVDSIGLNVEQLRAHVALDANAMNLVALNAGVDVGIDRVQLDITGVLAEAYLYADLDNVTRIVARVVQTLNNNPELLTRLLTVVDTTVSTVGGVANTVLQPGGVASQAVGAVGQTLQNVTQPGGLLSQTVNTLGQTVQRTVGTTGDVVERTVDQAGNVVGSRAVGNLLDLQGLRVLRETTGAAGQVVRQVQDQSGAVIEYTLDQAGRIASTRVIRQAQ